MPATLSIDSSVFFQFGAIKYTAWPTGYGDVLAKPQTNGPVAVLSTGDRNVIDAEWLLRQINSGHDDVLRSEFVRGLILLPQKNTNFKISEEAEKLLQSWGNDWIETVKSPLDPGPYFYKDNALWGVMRLYDDHQGAFLVSIRSRPTEPCKFEDANDGKHGWSPCSLAVPSRLISESSSRQPFAGWRVALKDAFDIDGMRTSMCNKAYLELYPPANATAKAIAHVVEGGASIVGKTKLSSFLSREEATESVDYQTAWNPRADGYQTPGGSSSGSAVAVAAYDWIDIGIGTDTNGSIRRPAQCNGVFGLRPSQGVFSQEGMFTVFKHFDVPGIVARDFAKLALFAEKWYGDLLRGCHTTADLPPKIVLPLDLLPTEDTPQKRIVLDFVKDLETYLQIRAERISVSDMWANTTPESAKGQSLHDFLAAVGKDSFLYANYHSASSFRNGYRQQFGKKPYVSPFVRWRWKVGSTVTKEEHQEAMRRMNVYKQWFLRVVMQIGVKNCFVVMQSENQEPKYRDDLPPEYYIQPAWHQWWLSPILGAPEIVIPAGQIEYESRITEQTEHLPVTAQILAQPGFDLKLVTMAQHFLAAVGRPLSVASGRSMYEYYENTAVPKPVRDEL